MQPDAPRDVTTYFTGLAQVYSQFRPTYPEEAIKWILSDLAAPIRAVDVGCGTGISTRLLAKYGAQVIGIDPNTDMLAQARRSESPSSRAGTVDYRQGNGERTGLDDASADLIVCAQSFHWFDEPVAVKEFHRVLKPDGRLALMWNIRNDRDPFTAEYSRLAELAQADSASRGIIVHDDRQADPTVGGYFHNKRQRSFANPQELDLDGLLGRARSASYFPKQDPLRKELESELRRLFELHRRGGRITLFHQTEVTLVDRAS